MLAGLLLTSVALFSQQQQKTTEPEKLAPYFPTPPVIAERMLVLSKIKPGEKMFDLGSGDGRIVILAASKFKADATGVELDDSLYKQSSQEIKRLGLDRSARIIHGNITVQDYSSANVLTVYLLPVSNSKIRPMLEKQLKKGTRIVAHDFEFSGWVPETIEHVEDDGEGRSHTIFVYRR
jgi:protein-L-isoaspartate O-methyltransferase